MYVVPKPLQCCNLLLCVIYVQEVGTLKEVFPHQAPLEEDILGLQGTPYLFWWTTVIALSSLPFAGVVVVVVVQGEDEGS